MVAAAIRTIFAQPDAENVGEQFEVIAVMLGLQLPKVEQMLRDATTTSWHSPGSRYRTGKIRSTNPLERLNKEVKRRNLYERSMALVAGNSVQEVAKPELMTA